MFDIYNYDSKKKLKISIHLFKAWMKKQHDEKMQNIIDVPICHSTLSVLLASANNANFKVSFKYTDKNEPLHEGWSLPFMQNAPYHFKFLFYRNYFIIP